MRVALEALDAPGRRAEDGERGAGLGGLRGVGEERGGRGRGGDETREGGRVVGARGGARAQSGATVHVSRSREKEGDAEGRGVGGDGRYGARRTNERRGSLCSHLLGRSAQERGRLSKHLRRPAPHGARGGRCGSTKRLARKDVRKRGRREGLPATREGRNGRPAPRRPTPRARSVRRGSRRSVAPRARFQSSRATPPRPRVVAFDDGRSRPAVVPRGFGPFFSSSPPRACCIGRFLTRRFSVRSPPARPPPEPISAARDPLPEATVGGRAIGAGEEIKPPGPRRRAPPRPERLARQRPRARPSTALARRSIDARSHRPPDDRPVSPARRSKTRVRR